MTSIHMYIPWNRAVLVGPSVHCEGIRAIGLNLVMQTPPLVSLTAHLPPYWSGPMTMSCLQRWTDFIIISVLEKY